MFERIRIKPLNDHIWLLDDAGEATGYLVAGREGALMIDTMNGIEDVHAAVRTLTDLPVSVINTHGHCDHIHGNIYFDNAMLHPADFDIARMHTSWPDFIRLCDEKGLSMPAFRPVQAGEEIDLGGLHLRVIALPGHTPGSICLLLREDRILFTGDGINRHLWLQMKESLPVRQCLENLERIACVKADTDRILHGHARDFEPVSLLDELTEGIRDLLETRGESDADYRWFAGTAKQHPFGNGKSVICYSPDRLG